ncbi:hypothetical protein BJX99DRAFT_107366 [Aspergillus californicus]
MERLILLATLLTAYSNVAAQDQDCFLMDGQLASDSHKPCNTSTTGHSACCATATDICLESGLCLSSSGLIFESACTDRTWESDACPSLCPDQSTNWEGKGSGNWTAGDERDYWQVMVCASGSVCCRASSGDPSCCDEDLVLEFNVGKPDLTTSVSTRTVTTTVTEGATGTSVDDATGTPSGNESVPTCQSDANSASASNTSGSNCAKRETTVGAAVGASLGAALIATLGAIWFLLQRQKKLVASLGQYQVADGQAPNTTAYANGAGVSPVSPVRTVQGVRPFVELDAERKYELGAETETSGSR